MAIKTFSVNEVLTASDTNTFLANSGLVFIKSDTITTGSSKEITGVFSSTYNNYRIVISNMKTTVPSGVYIQMGTNAANYYWAGITVGFASLTISAEGGSNTSNFNTGIVGSPQRGGGIIELQSPNRALETTIQCLSTDARTGGTGGRNNTGFLNNTTQYTSFTLSVPGTSFESCDIAVYGYRIP